MQNTSQLISGVFCASSRWYRLPPAAGERRAAMVRAEVARAIARPAAVPDAPARGRDRVAPTSRALSGQLGREPSRPGGKGVFCEPVLGAGVTAALEAVGAEHRVLNPQVRRAVGRVREQAFFRLIFLLHTPVPPATPGATTRQLPDGVVSTRGWRLSDVRVAQTRKYHRGNPSSCRCLLVRREGAGLLLLEHIDYTSAKGSERPNNATLKHASSWIREIGERLTLMLEV